MPQDSRHPFYRQHSEKWQRCRDAFEGSDVVKLASETYLPRPTGMTSEYNSYKKRAEWLGATRRIVMGLTGLVFRRAPIISSGPRTQMQAQQQIPTILAAMEERILTGQLGIWVDLVGSDQPINTLGAHWMLYPAESIISWLYAEDGVTLIRVMLSELAMHIDPSDPYSIVEELQYRELRLTPEGYMSLLWAKREGRFLLLSQTQPQRAGQPVPFVPFAFLQRGNRPPMLDLVDLNYSYYRTSADYEHDLHFTSMQTPIFTGWGSTPAELALGPQALVTASPDARAFMLSPSPAGLAAKQTKLMDTVSHMALLGSRILEPQRRTVEATDTVQIRQAGEQTALAVYAADLDRLCTDALRWHSWLIGETQAWPDETINMIFNKDYLPGGLGAQDLAALVASWQAGAITEEGLHYNLRQGEMLPAEELTFDAWQARRQLQIPGI